MLTVFSTAAMWAYVAEFNTPPLESLPCTELSKSVDEWRDTILEAERCSQTFFAQTFYKEGKGAINLNAKFDPGLFICVRPVGGLENH